MTRHSGYLWSVLAVCLMVVMGPGTVLAQDDTEEAKPSLYDRLGGLTPITVVVSDFIDDLVQDPVLNANPAIDAARQRVPAPYLKYRVTSLVCQAAGGPCEYRGRSMKDSHAHLNITEAEWAQMVSLLKGVLAEHGVPDQETEELLEIVGSTKEEIVTVWGDG